MIQDFRIINRWYYPGSGVCSRDLLEFPLDLYAFCVSHSLGSERLGSINIELRVEAKRPQRRYGVRSGVFVSYIFLGYFP